MRGIGAVFTVVAIVSLVFGMLLWLGSISDYKFKQRCEAFNGEVVYTGKTSLCLKRGTNLLGAEE